MEPGIKKLGEYCSSIRRFLVGSSTIRRITSETDFKQRIFSYATPIDRLWLTIAALSSAATGTTIPLMNIIFGMPLRHFYSLADLTLQ